MESVEKSDKIFGSEQVVLDNDAVEQARADLAKATSPETVRSLLHSFLLSYVHIARDRRHLSIDN